MPGFEWFGDEERKEVQDVLNNGVLFRYGFDAARQGHWKAKTFEQELARRIDSAHCLLCTNGTSALNIALASCGIGVGDEVVIPPFTFIATVEAILSVGAVPVFSEIDETLCLDPDALSAVVTPRTKAILPVHMCGAMARIDEIKAFCDRNGFLLIEDACQSIGATYHGKAVGTFGRIGCFSFDAVKTITCGEGGAVVTDDESLYLKADAYADHGHDHIGSDRGKENHLFLGANHRICELNAAVGLAQLRKLDAILASQRTHKKAIKKALSECDGIRFRELPDPDGDSATFLSFYMPDQDKARQLTKALAEAGVDGCFYWYENNWHYLRQWDHLKALRSVARLPIEILDQRPNYHDVDLPQSDAILGKTISMQIKLSWTSEDCDQRIEKIIQTIQSIG